MRIEIWVERSSFRRWHRALADRLSRKFDATEVRLRFKDGGTPVPGAVATLLAFERIVLRKSRDTIVDPLPPDGRDPRPEPDFSPDVVIDCTGAAVEFGDAPLVLRPLYDGLASEQALMAVLLSRSMPDIAIEDRRSGAVLAVGNPSAEAAQGLTGGMEAVLSRATILIERVLSSPKQVFAQASAPTRPAALGAGLAMRFALRRLATDCARSLYHLCLLAPHWRIGWRMHDGPGVLERGSLAGPRWHVLGDPGRRFFADPFPVVWEGRRFVFFEDLDHRVGKGTISAIEFGQDGPRGEVIPVLEEPWHLSYPFLMAHEGSLYMVPESSLSGAVPIYRCVGFPGRWERAGTLLDGIEAADCTIFRHDGRYWMMSAVRQGLGGYSDTLAIHYAHDPLGQWQEHSQRPVMVDVSAARPAGAVTARNGELWRPVQDCTKGYGRALGIARIERLDPHHFEQSVPSRINSGPLWPGGRLHTLNRCGPLECIDGTTYNPRLGALRPFANARMTPGSDEPILKEAPLLGGLDTEHDVVRKPVPTLRHHPLAKAGLVSEGLPSGQGKPPCRP